MLKATKATTTLSAEAGRVLIRQGEPVQQFLMVESGSVDVVVTLASGRELTIATLGAGQSVGETEILSEQPALATIRASAETGAQLSVLTKPDLLAVLADAPHQRDKLAAAAAERSAENQHHRSQGVQA